MGLRMETYKTLVLQNRVIQIPSRVGAREEDLRGTVLLDDPNLPFTFTDRSGVYYGDAPAPDLLAITRDIARGS